ADGTRAIAERVCRAIPDSCRNATRLGAGAGYCTRLRYRLCAGHRPESRYGGQGCSLDPAAHERTQRTAPRHPKIIACGSAIVALCIQVMGTLLHKGNWKIAVYGN